MVYISSDDLPQHTSWPTTSPSPLSFFRIFCLGREVLSHGRAPCLPLPAQGARTVHLSGIDRVGGAQLCVPPMGRSPMTSATATRPSRRTIWTGLYQTPASTTRPSRAMPEPSPRPAPGTRTATGSNIAPCRYYCPLGGQWGGGHSEHGLSSASPRGHHPVSESLGRMLGPFSPTIHFPDLHINLFGVVPKGHNTGKWRLITDLSFPPGMNDGVDSDLSTLSYSTVDQVTQIVVTLGEGALMAKVDIESSFRLIPVHPDHCPLQGMRWHSQVCIDPMLLFGLRSAPKIFNAVADALHWHLSRQGIPHLLHYLDY